VARLTVIEVQLNGSAETEAKPVQFATHELDGNISCTRTEMEENIITSGLCSVLSVKLNKNVLFLHRCHIRCSDSGQGLDVGIGKACNMHVRLSLQSTSKIGDESH